MYTYPDRARVCFIGDSITHNNLFLSHIVAYYREHLAQKKVEFYNCGIAGGAVSTTLNAFDTDIAPHDPTHAVIMIGINDSCRDYLNGKPETKYQHLQDAFDTYKENLAKLCNKLDDMGVNVVLCTPTPYAEYTESEETPLRGGYALMLGYADYVRAFAKEKGYRICDYHAYFTRLMQTEVLHVSDHIHLSDYGQYHMAKCFLAFQGYDLGEEKELPEDVKKWHDATYMVRDNTAVIHFLLDDQFDMPAEEKDAKIQAYLDNEQTGPYVSYFKSVAKNYIDTKDKHEEFKRISVDFMKNQ